MRKQLLLNLQHGTETTVVFGDAGVVERTVSTGSTFQVNATGPEVFGVSDPGDPINGNIVEMVRQTNRHDAFPYLPKIQAPVLIIAGERDDFTPLWLSRKMARLIPEAELMVLADASHAALIEQPETINHRIARFLRGLTGDA